MSSDGLDFSIVIVNYNTRDLIEACLTSIYQSRGEATFEVIVVDNNSSDGSTEMVRSRFKLVKVLANDKNQGFAMACNQGIRTACGKNILLLNSDTEVFPDTLDQVKKFLDKIRSDPKIGIIGCKILNPDRTLQYSMGKFPTICSSITDMFKPHYKRKYCLTGYDKPHEVDWVTGAFMLVDRQVIDGVGLLDEWYFMYYEDVDWCLRARKKGWKVFYYPAARIIHKNPYTFKQDKASEKVTAEIRCSHLYYYRKNHSYLSFMILSFTTIIFLLIKFFCLNTVFFQEKEIRRSRQRKAKLLLSVVWNTFWDLTKKASTV